MAYNNNMWTLDDYMPYSNDKVHQNSSLHLATRPSTSTASSDLSGFLRTTGPDHQELHSQPYCDCDLARGSYISHINFLPTPPHTNSDPKRSVPLPSLGSNAEAGPSSPISPRGRTCRQSPSRTKCVALRFPTPMTPPATVPTSTLALPPADAELSPIPTEHNNWDDSFCAFPSASTTPDHDNGVDPLLSPISPEWTTNNISYEAPLSLPSGGDSASVLLGSNYSHLFPAPGTLPYLHQSDDTNTSPHCRPILPHLDIPFHYMPPKGAWSDSPTSSMDYDDELDMLATPSTMDMDMPSTPKSFPTTPFSHELSLTSDDKLFENGFRNEKYGFYDPPLHEFEFLPELDDIPNSPSSPSLRGFSRLPGLELDDDNADDLMFTSPPSPGATLISLPGTDPDDFSDLGPQREQADFSLPPSPFSPSSSSLLLLDEEGLPRSPSPENYDVDPASTEDSSNPDIRRLGELRKRSSNAERAARQLEQALMEQGAVHQRWEARRARKKEKERGREIGAMLRLKMAEEMEKQKIEVEGIEAEVERERENGTPIRMRKGMISSMEQLVAKMMLRRNDSYRSLANRKTPLTSKFHMSSPLVRYGDLASDSDLDLDDELEGLTSFGTGDFDSEPWIPPAWTT